MILKEFPILTKGSEEAAKVALAAKMQGKYWEFHRAMLESQGQANEASALRVAEKLGLDMARLKKDMASRRGARRRSTTRARSPPRWASRARRTSSSATASSPARRRTCWSCSASTSSEVRKDGCKVC